MIQVNRKDGLVQQQFYENQDWEWIALSVISWTEAKITRKTELSQYDSQHFTTFSLQMLISRLACKGPTKQTLKQWSWKSHPSPKCHTNAAVSHFWCLSLTLQDLRQCNRRPILISFIVPLWEGQVMHHDWQVSRGDLPVSALFPRLPLVSVSSRWHRNITDGNN